MNTKDNWLTTATVHAEDRRALWGSIFPGAVVPIKSILTSKANLPGLPNVEVYMLDLEAISDEQREGLIEAISNRFGYPVEEVRTEIEQGVPVLADGVSVATRDQGLAFSLLGDLDDDDVVLAGAEEWMMII